MTDSQHVENQPTPHGDAGKITAQKVATST
jgi:hypothetical protein